MERQTSLAPSDLKMQYEEYISDKIVSPSPVYSDFDGKFRIATFNIHYFTDLYENRSTYRQVLDDIANINADIIVLQEVLVGGNDIPINKNINLDLETLFADLSEIGYVKKIMCNSVPSWFNGIYGNLMLVHSRICEPSNENSYCEFLDESIYTFPKSKHTTVVSGAHEGSKETRCYIKCKVLFNGYTLYIYGTHLDVADEEERVSQLKYMFSDANKHKSEPKTAVFIMGDFNTFSKDELDEIHNARISRFTRKNGNLFNEIRRKKWIDCHSTTAEKMTTWNGTRVDFIICNKKITGTLPEYYYTLSSDHIPVILTLLPEFSVTKSKSRTRKARSSKAPSSKSHSSKAQANP